MRRGPISEGLWRGSRLEKWNRGREDTPPSPGLHLGPRKFASVSQAPVSLWPELVAPPAAQQAAKAAASGLPHEQP